MTSNELTKISTGWEFQRKLCTYIVVPGKNKFEENYIHTFRSQNIPTGEAKKNLLI